MKLGQIRLTSGFLSISFGVFILMLSGLAGFYVPGAPSPQTTGGTLKATVTPTSSAVSTPAPQASPSSRTTQTAPSPASSPTSTPGPSATPTPTIYVVKAGDSASEIADKFGISTNALLKANNMTDPDKLAVGDKLVIPQR
ncbi:MAG: LysM peptidoglycan-binding domain-containing protein [Chloroflexi bacterium]|nr:LysM peptidoglycan-binding domain-containing protein [Chloroflexota bacterium]MDA8188854.1 LysM peptidoglycan-binding domain-containing protein [Dehalococcoidales bacterium]